MKNKKRKVKIRINRLITLLLFVFMVCFGSIVFLKSDFFSLRNIEIENNNILTKSDIKQLSKIKSGKNIFMYDLKKIESNIKQSAYIEDVSVKRKFPKSLIIRIEEKKILCVLKDKNKNYYYLDKNLNCIDKIKEESIKNNYLIVEMDFENQNDKKYLTTLIDNINEQGLNNRINYINFTEKNQIYMKVDEKIEVIISKDKNIDHNISKLTKILVDLDKQNIHHGKIDMTFSKYVLYNY